MPDEALLVKCPALPTSDHLRLQGWRRGTRLQRRVLALNTLVTAVLLLSLAAYLAWKALLWSFAFLWGIFCWVFWDPPVYAAISETVILGEHPACRMYAQIPACTASPLQHVVGLHGCGANCCAC